MPWKKGNRIRLVREQEAPPETRLIYQQIKETFGIPYVGIVFQAYAGFPHFLGLHWERVQRAVNSQRFFELCDRLRADSYTRAHNYFHIPDLCARVQDLSFSSGAKDELTDTIEQFYYANSLYLLVVVAQQQAFEGQVGSASASISPPSHPVFEHRPVLVDDESASPEINKVFEEVKRDFGLPMVISDFRAIARWPDFLRAYWSLLHPLLSSPLYQECQYGIRETAWSFARELPGPFELSVAQMADAGMNEDDIASVVRVTQAFTRGLSGSALNIAVAKIGLEGGNYPRREEQEEKQVPSEASDAPIKAA